MYVPFWTQRFPTSGPLNEYNLPNQTGRVLIVTDGASRLGYVLSRILYGSVGRVYVIARSKERTDQAIANIKSCYEGKNNGNSGRKYINSVPCIY